MSLLPLPLRAVPARPTALGDSRRPAIAIGLAASHRAADRPPEGVLLKQHFTFGRHPEYGFVAAPTANTTPHLAHWYLTAEQFEPVPGVEGLYRLASPEYDGVRRTRQAVHDLRQRGFDVHADYTLDPARSAGPPQAGPRAGLMERRTRIAQAAGIRSSQYRPAVATQATPTSPRPAGPPHTTGQGQAR